LHYASDCAAKVQRMGRLAKKNGQNSILQFDPLKHSTIKLSCKLTYTPQNLHISVINLYEKMMNLYDFHALLACISPKSTNFATKSYKSAMFTVYGQYQEHQLFLC
ncbi:MAG: hypothetical protein IJ243_08800, partial [Prevotella sp.]|nr:hypothetical protein [Prevotella sp.]